MTALLTANDTQPARGPGHASEIQILIVDDNPDDRDIIGAIIANALPDAEIKFAENGFDALVMIGEKRPDVLILDIIMPNMDGIEMLRHLARRPASQPDVVIAVSGRKFPANSLPAQVEMALKPLDPTAFSKLLRNKLAAARAGNGKI